MSPSSVTFYSRPFNLLTQEYHTWKRHELTRENHTGGKISYHARRRINKAISWLLFYSKQKKVYLQSIRKTVQFRINFITLTLSAPQTHSDQEIKSKLLNNFLTVFRQKYGAMHYMWKAERQKNGNIHFHIISDTFIHYATLQKEWNRIQETLGYISEFEKKHGHRDPHSTEVKAVRKVKNLKAYFAKYFLKDDTKNPINGRLWFASKSLLKIPSITASEAEIDFSEVLGKLSAEPCEIYKTEYSTTFFISIDRLSALNFSQLTQLFREETLDHWSSQNIAVPNDCWENLCRIG